MTKESKQLLLWFALIVVMVTALGYGICAGAKADSLEQKLVENEQEIKALNVDLKSYSGLLLDRDIRLQEKDSTIQMMSSQIEGLTWQLQTGGSQDE